MRLSGLLLIRDLLLVSAFSLFYKSSAAFSLLRPPGPTILRAGHNLRSDPQQLDQRRRTGVVRWNVWSNPQAVEDYQNLLNGIVDEVTTDQASLIVVGDGYRGLANCLQTINPRGNDVVVEVGPDLVIPEIFPGDDGDEDDVGTNFPVYLCVAAEELAGIIDKCPAEKKDDLVFLSDGFLEPVLKTRGCCGKTQTQAVLWLTFNQYGVAYDGRTSMGDNANGLAEWAGESTATGKWAGALTERLGYGDLFCRVMFYRDWRRWMLEKVVYGAVVNIVGALHPKSDGKPSTHADVANYFSEEVEQMVDELGYTLRGYMAVTLLSGSSGRICAVAEANGRDVPCEVTPASFALYNKLFWDNSMLARDRGFPDTCSMHTEYVEYGIEKKNIDPEVIVEKKKKYY